MSFLQLKHKPQILTTLYLCLQRCIQSQTRTDDGQICPATDTGEREGVSCEHTYSSRSLSLPTDSHAMFLLSATPAALPASANSLQNQEEKVGKLHTQMNPNVIEQKLISRFKGNCPLRKIGFRIIQRTLGFGKTAPNLQNTPQRRDKIILDHVQHFKYCQCNEHLILDICHVEEVDQESSLCS